MSTESFYEWLSEGILKGYCTAEFCYFHDGPELNKEEDAEALDGGDPCVPCIRLWEPSL
jgi:hypothetical protein